MAELLPCPFCGSYAEIVRPSTDFYIIGCSNEDCPMWSGLGFISDKRAIEFWNTRTPKEMHEKHTKTHDNTPKERGGEK